MPIVSFNLYSVFFKLLQSLLLQAQDQDHAASRFGITCGPDESTAPANPTFDADSVATKDIHVDPLSSLSLLLFLSNGYGGYLPSPTARRPSAVARKLSVILQFHGGAFVAGSNASSADGFFCRRIAKLLDAIVVSVGTVSRC